jgi:hypothetical protein
MPCTEKERCHPCCGEDEDPNPFSHWIVDRTDEIVAEPEVPPEPFFLLESGCLPTLAIILENQIRPAAAVTHQVCVKQEVCVTPEVGREAQVRPEVGARPAEARLAAEARPAAEAKAKPAAKPAKKPAARKEEEG